MADVRRVKAVLLEVDCLMKAAELEPLSSCQALQQAVNAQVQSLEETRCNDESVETMLVKDERICEERLWKTDLERCVVKLATSALTTAVDADSDSKAQIESPDVI